MSGLRLEYLKVYGWPCAPYLAVHVSTGDALLKGVEKYSKCDIRHAYGWILKAVDNPLLPAQGFDSVLEHVIVQYVARCSRVCTHELVRHRHSSYTQSTTRNNTLCLIAEGKAKRNVDVCEGPPVCVGNMCGRCSRTVRELCKSSRAREAWDVMGRYFLPLGVTQQIMVTTNLREIIQFISLRTHEAAHLEIRNLALALAHRLSRDYGVPVVLMSVIKTPKLLVSGHMELPMRVARDILMLSRILTPRDYAWLTSLPQVRPVVECMENVDGPFNLIDNVKKLYTCVRLKARRVLRGGNHA